MAWCGFWIMIGLLSLGIGIENGLSNIARAIAKLKGR